MQNALTLAFDTSAAHCAAALLSGNTVMAQRVETMVKVQAERLFGVLDELMSGVGVTWKDLGRIGVGVGPGNFTGIRISVAAARGLALSLEVPAIGVSTFAALAHELPRPVVACVDARGGRMYVQHLGQTEAKKPLIADADVIPAHLFAKGPCVVGHHARELAARHGGEFRAPKFPVAVAIAKIAAASDARQAPRPVPLYVRAPDAAPPRQRAPVILP
ncbi:tRNA (adenosine(37)-N6)-threonylcarbamoyltransferase complex dimerization subunit type 1 TsaB [Rhodobacteraceae bacterium R_SAG10]|nr:tRNA (adenosine(37)-N6)-threonylcarbamoyltransferase complex dimerization subunit type 1 TsaB [Rhodobacteraceae bacterium R_SAG10]